MQFRFISFLIFGLFLIPLNIAIAQDAVSPIVDYSFSNNTVVDETGYSNLSLFNQTTLYQDSKRGSVLRFSALSKSYAVFDKQLLDSDNCTISFFFYWENSNATSWHQLFELHDATNNTNLFFTPQNGWSGQLSSLVSDNKDYNLYEVVNGDQLPQDQWKHIAIVFEGKQVKVFIDGTMVNSGQLMCTPGLIKNGTLYLGGNPNRSDNYYISARLDELKIFDKALASNQVSALFQEKEIPESIDEATNWQSVGNPIELTIDLTDKKQTIRNFGASDGWNTEKIGKYWPQEKKEKLAELLFSTEKDAEGNPKGIGLSAWRFNIGAGTTEQGDASRISNEDRRTEGFLNADGETYNWNKQQGQQWFLRKAAIDYKVNDIIGWQNSPPVQFTKYNLGFREYGASMSTILKREYFDAFANFLADVSEHFEGEGITFDYISPLNEPQFSWSPSEFSGTVTQEGTPWTNQEIHDVVSAIDNAFSARGVDTKLFITEAASVSHHLGGTGHADNQLYNFWNSNSSLSLNNKSSLANIVSFHSYWKDHGATLIDTRSELNSKIQNLATVPEVWQTEYSMLGTGYRQGYPDGYKLSEMECALSLARVIMTDLNVANVTGWQWWTTFEKGKHGGESRFSLIEAITNSAMSDGTYHLNKLFYALGHFSHFIRPGMTRLTYSRSDNLNIYNEANDIMYSAYTNADQTKLVMVAVNFSDHAKEVNISFENGDKKVENEQLFLSNAHCSLANQKIGLATNNITVPAQSIVTYTADLSPDVSVSDNTVELDFKVFLNSGTKELVVQLSEGHQPEEIRVYDITGNLLAKKMVRKGQRELVIGANQLSSGTYLVSGFNRQTILTRKVVVFGN
ncbi:hypothetical protein J1N10_17405 [Carboxylicivirga sp. A043]|uniref:glycoside hydrolase n=1 Tax=Carboxylicivirga litoralis TaxID=2816963 RepID=UPI0021CB864F|nr:glycoside hydrolase [Carboxylicivirga sp. A043]MCU4157756.1 hypothetical protein [Carboxylicivirga sp. A043]